MSELTMKGKQQIEHGMEQRCLFTDGVNISVERYKEDALDHFFPAGRWFSLEDAIAWMPLPKQYRKGDV